LNYPGVSFYRAGRYARIVNGFLVGSTSHPMKQKPILLAYPCNECYPMLSERIEYDVKEDEPMAKDKGKDKDKKKKEKKDKKKAK
jgi:hypothetical protein